MLGVAARRKRHRLVVALVLELLQLAVDLLEEGAHVAVGERRHARLGGELVVVGELHDRGVALRAQLLEL